MRRAMVALGVLLIAVAANDAAAKQPDARKSVCVISEIGQDFNLKKIGLMVFANEEESVPIPSWKFDDRVYAKVSGMLKKNFRVKRIDTPQGAFASLYQPGDLFRDRDDEARQIVRKLVAGSQCDYDLVIFQGVSQFSSSNQYLRGLGVLETGTEVFGKGHNLFALAYYKVYEGKGLTVIRREWGDGGQSTFMAAIRGPFQEIDAEAHPSLRAVADDPKVRDIVWALLDKSLSAAIPKLLATD